MYKKTPYQSVAEIRIRTKLRLIAALGGECVCCGYNKCKNALALHHVNPSEKDFNISHMSTASWAKICVEAQKCVLVCHNCHGEIHEGVRILPSLLRRFDEKYIDYKSMDKINNP